MHRFLLFPPRDSASRAMRSDGRRVIFRECPEDEKHRWNSKFWKDGYFSRTGGGKGITEVIRKYIQYHRDQETLQNSGNCF